jgi:hypothetical protein
VTPPNGPDTVAGLNPADQPTVAEELAEDSLRDLGTDWAEPTDWDTARWSA